MHEGRARVTRYDVFFSCTQTAVNLKSNCTKPDRRSGLAERGCGSPSDYTIMPAESGCSGFCVRLFARTRGLFIIAPALSPPGRWKKLLLVHVSTAFSLGERPAPPTTRRPPTHAPRRACDGERTGHPREAYPSAAATCRGAVRAARCGRRGYPRAKAIGEEGGRRWS